MDQLQSPTLRRVRLARRLRQMREANDPLLVLSSRRAASSSLKFLAGDAAKPDWWRKYGMADRSYIAMETEAATVHEFGLMHVPGLLQTEAYIRAVFATDLHRISGVKTGANSRRHGCTRQGRLTGEEFPLELSR